MAKPINKHSLPDNVVLDTDVIVNWLTQEVETGTGKNLWEAPYKIFELLEKQRLQGYTGLTNILELRFLLRRKRNISDRIVEKTLRDLETIIEIVIPDEITLLYANRLQSENHLDPFDSILTSITLSMQPTVLLSRDKTLLQIASNLFNAITPDDFVLQFQE